MHKRIFHISLDEKFTNSAIEQFEVASPNRNLYYILTNKNNNELLHVDSSLVNKITKGDLLNLAKQIQESDVVVFHSLPQVFFQFLNTLNKKVKTVWLCYGFEVYNDPFFFRTKHLLDNKTRAYYKGKEASAIIKYIQKVRPIIRLVNSKLKLSDFEHKQKAFNRIDFIGTSFQEEYANILKLTHIKKPLFSYWHYPLEHIVDVNSSIATDRNNILVGNSASITNNHIDVFEVLKNSPLKPFNKIILPLSYGDEDYKNIIIKYGEKYFDKKFYPLIDFMPLVTYNNILKTCGIAIFNNKRQQAIGNTIALLWFGAKVFLSKDNPFYQFLIRKQVTVFNVEFDLKKANALEVLNKDVIVHNREILRKLLGEKNLKKQFKEQLKMLGFN